MQTTGAACGTEVLTATPEQQEAQTAHTASAPEQGNWKSQALHRYKEGMATQACSSRNFTGEDLAEARAGISHWQLLAPRSGKISARVPQVSSGLLQGPHQLGRPDGTAEPRLPGGRLRHAGWR